jgi:hypothetical protein
MTFMASGNSRRGLTRFQLSAIKNRIISARIFMLDIRIELPWLPATRLKRVGPVP